MYLLIPLLITSSFFFFFSSRRRHTRFSRDWSSDVCSSDLDGTTRHILIDVGNVLAGEGGLDAVFKPVVEAIKAELGGKPLDLYVMTHEHMDHIQGLPFAKEKAGLEVDVDFAWITASAAPDYYDTHPNAKKKKLEAVAAYEQIAEYLQASPDRTLEGLMLNNNPRSTADCVQYLRGLGDNTAYVFR